MELLGLTSPEGELSIWHLPLFALNSWPSDPEYLATCPDIRPPRLEAIGMVGNPLGNSPQYYTFTVSGYSSIVRQSISFFRFCSLKNTQDKLDNPFTIKARIDKMNTDWSNFAMPTTGTSVHVVGPIVDRDDSGLFVINLAHMTYHSPVSVTAPSTSTMPSYWKTIFYS